MSINLDGAAQVSLTVFGGLSTEMAAVDLPEGVSPDNQDVEYIPGSVYSRRGLAAVFAVPWGHAQITYAKSFVMPTGDIRNIYLDSKGNFWWEDVSNDPGVYQSLGVSVSPGSFAKSITAFGREYIAVSDLLHGTDIPLQWDGTYLDRVTQDGPGTTPTVANLSLPAVSMAANGSAPTLTITGIFPSNQVNGYYTTIGFFVTSGSGAAAIPIGELVYCSGTGSAFDSSVGYIVIDNPGYEGAITCQAYFPDTQSSYIGGGTLTVGSGGVTLSRQGNIVTVQTAAQHNLQVGYQAQISGPSGSTLPPLAVGGGIASIVINNESLPGIAVVTTNDPHGLVPENQVLLHGITGVNIGGYITGINWTGGITTVQTETAHGLNVGALVTIDITNSAPNAEFFNGNWIVTSIINPNAFTFAMTPLSIPAGANGYNGAAGDDIQINWPVPDTPDPAYFEVVSCPSPTSFQVEVEYADGVWTTGSVGFPWDGIFFVASVPTSESFTYQQYGPPGTSNTVGTVTPWGQVAPGLHQMQVLFLTRQGYLTRPSPPVNIEANGGQYLSVTNIPIGPANIVARVLAFTGAGGAYFFYIPTPPQENGQVVASPTQINDNVTTAVVLDFSDNTLFSSLGISVPGNTPANEIVIDGALGFGYYASRLVTWGQRNRIQNLLNMGFYGGYAPNAPTLPTGWSLASGSMGGQLALGANNRPVWQVSTVGGNTGAIQQPMYEDAYGVPIAQPNTQYIFRAWAQPSGGVLPQPSVLATISSASTGFAATALLILTNGNEPGFLESYFSAKTPLDIPSDLTLTISVGGGVQIQIGELSIIYAEDPYLDPLMYMSYTDNPEAFDGVTGKIGAVQDTHKVMDIGIIRQTMYFLTQDPGGRLHETSDNGTTEPAGWTVNQVAANCGLLSALALTKSQADDTSASGGEEWFAWASATGARIFGGDEPWKISQEIQPDWDSISTATAPQGVYSVSPAYLTCWALNDPDGRLLLFGLPIGNLQTNPNRVYAMSYRELETAFQIATQPPIHTSFTGRLIATDHTRKWSRWNMTMNGAALMYRTPNPNIAGGEMPALPIVLFGGNGGAPDQITRINGNVYTLSSTKYTDDEYGLISPYYTTYFFVTHDQEQQLSYQLANGQRVQLGAGRKLLQYLTAFVGAPSGLTQTQSVLTLTFLCNSLTNPWSLNVQRTLSPTPTIDLECGGGSAIGNRIAIKISSAPANPAVSLDNGFVLDHLAVWMKAATHLPIRGAAQ